MIEINWHCNIFTEFLEQCLIVARSVRKEMKCSGETEILHELVHDTTRKSESHELIRVVS